MLRKLAKYSIIIGGIAGGTFYVADIVMKELASLLVTEIIEKKFKKEGFNEERYSASTQDLKKLLETSYHIHSLSLKAVETIIKSEELMEKFQIPKELRKVIRKSWENNQGDILSIMQFYYEEGSSDLKFVGYTEDKTKQRVQMSFVLEYYARLGKFQQFNFLSKALIVMSDKFEKEPESELYMSIMSQEDDKVPDVEKSSKNNSDDTSISDFMDSNQLIYEKGNPYLIVQSPSGEKKEIPWIYSMDTARYLKFKAVYKYLTQSKETKTVLLEPIWKIILYNTAFLPFMYSQFPEDQCIMPAHFVNKQNKANFLSSVNSTPGFSWTSEAISSGIGEQASSENQPKYQPTGTSEEFYDAVAESGKKNKKDQIVRPDYLNKKNGKGRILSTCMVYGVPISMFANVAKPDMQIMFTKAEGMEKVEPNFMDQVRMSRSIKQRLYGNNQNEMITFLQKHLKGKTKEEAK